MDAGVCDILEYDMTLEFWGKSVGPQFVSLVLCILEMDVCRWRLVSTQFPFVAFLLIYAYFWEWLLVTNIAAQ